MGASNSHQRKGTLGVLIVFLYLQNAILINFIAITHGIPIFGCNFGDTVQLWLGMSMYEVSVCRRCGSYIRASNILGILE
jgi:hypothetical protein